MQILLLLIHDNWTTIMLVHVLLLTRRSPHLLLEAIRVPNIAFVQELL